MRGVQRDVAVGVQFADRHVEPFALAEEDDRVNGEVEELTFAQSGACEDLDADSVEQVGQFAGGGEQLGGVRVVEEPGQRPVRGGMSPAKTGLRSRASS